MSDPAKPPSRARRVVVTLIAIALALVLQRVPLPGIDWASIDAQLGESGVHGAATSIAALGVTPFLSASVLVELCAWIVPGWRSLRFGDGRKKLGRAAVLIGAGLALLQAQGLGHYFASVDYGLGLAGHVRVVVSLVAGSCALLLLAQWITERGFGNGLVVLTALGLVGTVLGWDQRDVVLSTVVDTPAAWWLAQALASALVVVAVAAAIGLPRARAAIALPQPASGLVPIELGATLLGAPAAFTVPLLVSELGRLAPWADLGRGGMFFVLVHLVVVLLGAIVLAWAFYGPRRVAAVLGGDRVARDRALVWSGAVSALTCGAIVLVQDLAAGVLGVKAPALALGLAVALAFDGIEEWRARGREVTWTAVAAEHRPYAAIAARAALERAEIAVHVRNLRQRSILQALGPYVPIEILVPATELERSRALCAPLLAPAPAAADVVLEHRPPLRPLAVIAATVALALISWGILVTPTDVPVDVAPAQLELLPIDDESRPFESHLDDATLPGGARFEIENAPVGPGRNEPHHFLRLPAGDVAPEAHAFLASLALPPGRRWLFQKLYDLDDASDGLLHSGWRTHLVQGEATVTSRHLREVQARFEPEYASWWLNLTLDDEGARRFEALTREHVRRRIAIVVDGEVMSAPVVNEPIGGGMVRITMGSGSAKDQARDAKRLEASLRASMRR